MAIIYRTAGAWGAGNGANLTPANVDANFWDHEGRIVALETSPPEPNNIASITASGSQLTVTMDDASTFGPFTIPTARFEWVGDWTDATAYAINNVIRDADTGSIYLVIKSHTSDTTFDAAYEVGGEPVYELMIDAAELGGGGGGVLGVVTDSGTTINPTLDQANYYFLCSNLTPSDYNNGINPTNFVIPDNSSVAFPIGTQLWVQCYGNHVLVYGGGGASVDYPNDRLPRTRHYGAVVVATKIATNGWMLSGDLEPYHGGSTVATTTTTLIFSQRNKYIKFTHASGCTVTVPPNASTAFPIGTQIDFIQGSGAGAVTLAPGSGVTFVAKAGSTYTTAEVGAVIHARKTDTNEWYIWGEEL
jgi:hypothetical protein